MSASPPSGGVYRLTDWEVDLGHHELRFRGARVPLGSRAIGILQALLAADGEVVSQATLMQHVWPGQHVDPNTLQVHLAALRKALGAERALVQTVSGRGYRLVGSWSFQPTRRGSAGGQASATAPQGKAATNLPLRADRLIGRTVELQQVRDLLAAGRMVTLTGAGGIGKTRLAIEAARAFHLAHGQDCWMVELASLSDPQLVPSAVATAIGLEINDEARSVAAVTREIGRREMLLVLDNCEHLIDAVAECAEAILARCPGIAILATSRESLRVSGEQAFRVPALELPPEEGASASPELHGAVQLFVSRTRALQLAYSPDAREYAAVATICRRLDGIPLAIEFAAARTATLGSGAVLSGLEDRFGLLTAGFRTALPRHRTLQATLDWSYDLLPKQEQLLFRALGIFAAGITIDAILAVGPVETDPNMLESLASLVAKSLVLLDSVADVPRWRLLDTTRAYARDRMAEHGEFDVYARRHAEYLLRLFTPAVLPAPLHVLDTQIASHGAELPDVRAALEWAFGASGDFALGGMLTAGFAPIWRSLSLMGECNAYVERALSHLESTRQLAPDTRMRLLVVLGVAALFTLGSIRKAMPVLIEGLRLAQEQGVSEYLLLATWAMWSALATIGEQRQALRQAEDFSALADRSEDPYYRRLATRMVGSTLHYAGDQAAAHHALDLVIRDYAQASGPRRAFWLHYDDRVLTRAVFARMLWLGGHVELARDQLRLSLDDAEVAPTGMESRYPLAWAAFPIALFTGDLAAARNAVEWLASLAVERSLPFWESSMQCIAGMLAIAEGDVAAGCLAMQAGLQACVATGWTTSYASFLGSYAEGLARLGQVGEALAAIEKGIAWSRETGEGWALPELHRIRGELALRQARPGHADRAELCFERAASLAREQAALFWELRAVLSRARLHAATHRAGAMQSLLAATCARFPPGTDTADLREAWAILKQPTANVADDT